MGCVLIVIGLILIGNQDSNMQCLGVILILIGISKNSAFGSRSK